MLRIRLFRTGAKKKPHYRIVVINRETRRDGRCVEILGHYNPQSNPAEIVLNRERAEYWIKCGAQPSDTVRGLMKKAPTAQPETQAVSHER